MALFHSETRRHIMIIGDMLLIQPFRESYLHTWESGQR